MPEILPPDEYQKRPGGENEAVLAAPHHSLEKAVDRLIGIHRSIQEITWKIDPSRAPAQATDSQKGQPNELKAVSSLREVLISSPTSINLEVDCLIQALDDLHSSLFEG